MNTFERRKLLSFCYKSGLNLDQIDYYLLFLKNDSVYACDFLFMMLLSQDILNEEAVQKIVK
jgi:hypothetical protein